MRFRSVRGRQVRERNCAQKTAPNCHTLPATTTCSTGPQQRIVHSEHPRSTHAVRLSHWSQHKHECCSASGHAWLQQDSSCAPATYLKLPIGMGKVVAGGIASSCLALVLLQVLVKACQTYARPCW